MIYTLAFVLICATGIVATLGGIVALITPSWSSKTPKGAELSGLFITLAYIAAAGILTHALYISDFSVVYVASYTDLALPMFYKITAFWAGQAGSLLFWALAVAISGTLFISSRYYAQLGIITKRWYWIFFLLIMAFFALLLTTWSNPFLVNPFPPEDGNGLNPLLQNPGMIFHPPLLFLGYGGFTVPACLALAQSITHARDKKEIAWMDASRPFMLGAWAFLTAGIILGAWWAYMELGWGGYWAWDPVENASLIPWLVATAALHTCAVETRRNKLSSSNVFLICLTTLSAFFATYLVRSGVVQSVHAFGDGGVGVPLLIFVLVGTVLCVWVALIGKRNTSELAGLESREGFMILTAWLLLLLAGIILVATMWPVFSSWFTTSFGLKADFYNRVCMPIFAVLIALLAICPWLKWEGGLQNRLLFFVICGAVAGTMAALWFMGYRLPTPILGAGAAVGILVGIILLQRQTMLKGSRIIQAIHVGVAFIALGIAFSGPFKTESDIILSKGEKAQIGAYSVVLDDVAFGHEAGYQFMRGTLSVSKDGTSVGVLNPERRIYEKWRGMQFAEASTSFSLGNELYASLLAIDEKDNVQFRISINPLVNWLWIGGALLSLLPFLILRPRMDGRPSEKRKRVKA